MLNSSMELEIGQFVKSKSGRDKDRIFIVIDRENEQYVHIVDGDLRKLEKPKRKKVKHLKKIDKISQDVNEKFFSEKKLTNAIIRKEIEKAGLIE